MGFFDNDDFDSIFSEFFRTPGKTRGKREPARDDEDRVVDFIEQDDKIFMIFELPGFGEDDVEAVVKDKFLNVIARKSNGENVRDYLSQKLANGLAIRKSLPDGINLKSQENTFRNGILEVSFEKR